MCGHFQISFWTFFFATWIGKAVIKMSIQSLITICIFSKQIMDAIIGSVSRVFPKSSEAFQQGIEN